MEIILFFQSTLRKSWRQKLAGVHKFAREHNWFVQVIDRYATVREIRHAIDEWSPRGCLVDRAMNRGAPPDLLFKDIPAVYLDQDPSHPSRLHPCLLHGAAAEAARAGAELIARTYASYAYIGTGTDVHWDKARLAQFRKDVASAGAPFTLLPAEGLKEAICRLPKPCGILGANDGCAVKAFHAATAAGFSVPDDVAIIGIDNDEIYCEAVSPGLTSVEPDFEGAGYRLAQMLAEEIEKRETGKGNGRGRRKIKTEFYGPLRIVRRGSTAATPVQNPSVRRALEYIRRHACEATLRLDDVISEMHCSRRFGTRLFKQETEKTILDVIHEQRFQKACDLLAHTRFPIATVVLQCGYRSDSFVKKMFLARTGMTMREYRKCACNPISGGVNASSSQCSP